MPDEFVEGVDEVFDFLLSRLARESASRATKHKMLIRFEQIPPGAWW